jgi:aspartate aminotransferase
VEEGDEVIIPSPYWLSYPEMVTLAGGTSVILKTEMKKGYRFSAAELEPLVTKRTRLLILNSPSNPTGAVLTQEDLSQIADLAKRHSFFILSDEIYEKLIFEGAVHHSIGAFDPAVLERTITVGGASKAYAMTGWRLGFSASPKPVAEACASLQSHSTSNPTSFAQAGYLEALKVGQPYAQNMREAFEKRRDLMFRLVSGIPRLKPFKPSGAFYLFVDISEIPLTSLEFADRLLGEARVALVPGIAFGDDHAVRISFAASEQMIEAGIARLCEWLKQI